jgi:hypothetical protein
LPLSRLRHRQLFGGLYASLVDPNMAKIRRNDLPPALLQHLLDRIQSRKISADQLVLLAGWLDTEPEVPEGPWYKRFPGMTVCGDGELIKTFLLPGQSPKGSRVS